MAATITRDMFATHAITFETETCLRCGGTGKHSYNALDGDRCYGCGGKGTKFTRDAAKAHQRYHELLDTELGTRADEIQAGDQVRVELPDYATKWRTVHNVSITNGVVTLTFVVKTAAKGRHEVPVIAWADRKVVRVDRDRLADIWNRMQHLPGVTIAEKRR
jgi:hypothetical protein